MSLAKGCKIADREKAGKGVMPIKEVRVDEMSRRRRGRAKMDGRDL